MQDTLNAPLFPNFSRRTGAEPNFGRAKIGEMYDKLASRPIKNNGKPPIPRFPTDAELLKYEFQSEMLRRSVFTGKVDEGIKTGDLITTATSIAAPIAVGKVLTPIKAPQGLGLPKTASVQVQAEKQAAGLLAQAQKSEPAITADLTQAAKQNGGEMVGLKHRLKSQESLARKIADRTLQNADKLTEKGTPRNQAIQKAMQTQVGGTNDALRYTVSLSKQKYAKDVNQTLAALQKQGYNVQHTYDGWKLQGTPNDPGYRGLNVTLKSPNGQTFELQFHTPESFANKSAGHVLYEEARNPLTSTARKEQIRQIQVKEAENVPTPPNIEQLPSTSRPRKGAQTQ